MTDAPKVVICTVAVNGGWYPDAAARLIHRFQQHSPGYEIQAHVNVLPFGAPRDVIEDDANYTGYCAKPFALMQARMSGADIAILLDAAYYPIRHIYPLVEHVTQHGYYFGRTGNKVGNWVSDRCLDRMWVKRDESLFKQEEIASGCVGLNFSKGFCVDLLYQWVGYAADRLTFAGPREAKTQTPGESGFVSTDPRVLGHRNDQACLSILAKRLNMNKYCESPLFTAYYGRESDKTVLVNHGGGAEW